MATNQPAREKDNEPDLGYRLEYDKKLVEEIVHERERDKGGFLYPHRKSGSLNSLQSQNPVWRDRLINPSLRRLLYSLIFGLDGRESVDHLFASES